MTPAARRNARGVTTAGSHAVAAVAEQVFGTVRRIREAASAALAAGAGDLADAVDRIAVEVLRAPSQPAVGLGAVLEPVAAQRLRWWQVDPAGGALQMLNPDLRPSSLGYYDYLAADWFQVPRRTGQRHVVGPYIDVHGTGQYLLTFTEPVTVQGRFAGVVGADVPVRRLEAHVLSLAPVFPSSCVLLNAERRVVLSTSPRWLVGALADVPRRAVADRLAAGSPVAGVPWTLQVVEPTSAG